MIDVTNDKPSDKGIRIPVRIKIKSVKHYCRVVQCLKDYGVQVPAELADELNLRRNKKYCKRAWVWIGTNDIAWVFDARTLVRYAKVMTRKEYITWRQSIALNG